MLYVCGIDPGANGALAFFNAELAALEVFPMPTTTREVRGKRKREVDPVGVAEIVRRMRTPELVLIERVSAMPNQGVTSMFSFGRALGVIEGVTAGFRMNVDWVTPQVWKKHYGLIKADKNASRAKAQEVFPAYRDLFARAKDDGLAEAALIAMWGVIHAAE